jgi:hypothetical protein
MATPDVLLERANRTAATALQKEKAADHQANNDGDRQHDPADASEKRTPTCTHLVDDLRLSPPPPEMSAD